MNEQETWQQRVRELYANVEDLYAHVEITIVVFDRELRTEQLAADDPLLTGVRDVARRVVASGEVVHDVALDETGRRRAHGHPLRGTDGVTGVVCVIEDEEARRELFVRCALAIFDGYRQQETALLERERVALEAAQRANHLRDQFMATVSHELRAPLAATLLWAEVLRNDTIDDETRVRALDMIHDSANAQTLLVDDLLDVTRAITGKLHVDLGEVPIERVLTTAIENARPIASGRHLAIETMIESDLGAVLGDRHRLQQIFDNLLSNAIKCTEQGRISLRAESAGTSIAIEVTDTGRGIAREFLPFVFEPFSQDERADLSQGLGLGLAIARQLVELHGGTVTASSEGPGRGATFRVTLPRLPGMSESSPRAIDALPHLAGVRVLVVDDDYRVLDALRLLLRRIGATVSIAQSVADAEVLLQHDPVDVVLSDLAMPGEDGCSFMERLRRTRPALPAIAITAHAAESGRNRALAAGFDVCLPKPINIAVLAANVARLAASGRPGRD
jgi:signal transduction histidine kinase